MGDKIKNSEKTGFRRSFIEIEKSLIFPIKQAKKNLESRVQSGK